MGRDDERPGAHHNDAGQDPASCQVFLSLKGESYRLKHPEMFTTTE